MRDGMTIQLMEAQSVTMVMDGTGNTFRVDLGQGVTAQFTYAGLKDVKILSAHIQLRVEFERKGDTDGKSGDTPIEQVHQTASNGGQQSG